MNHILVEVSSRRQREICISHNNEYRPVKYLNMNQKLKIGYIVPCLYCEPYSLN